MQDKAKLRDERAARIRPGQNGPLLVEWLFGIDELRTSFGAEPLYYLNSLRTDPDFRGQGLASKLVKLLVDEADEKGARIGLYTDGDQPARRLYEKFGFVEAGRHEINLERFGGQGRHLELSMIREPVTSGETRQK